MLFPSLKKAIRARVSGFSVQASENAFPVSDTSCETSGGMDSIFNFLDRIYPPKRRRTLSRINVIFFAYAERPFGLWPLYPDNPVDPV